MIIPSVGDAIADHALSVVQANAGVPNTREPILPSIPSR